MLKFIYVVTASHVVKYSDQDYELVTPDDRRYHIDYDKIQQQEGQDVALVQFTSNEIYPVATLANYRVKLDWVFTAGWPKGESLRNPQFQCNPGLLFSSEQNLIISENTASLTEGYEMVYTNITHGGMSGGPVLDTHGRVMGIHGRAESGEFGGVQLGRSLGIPTKTLLGSLQLWGIKRQWLQVETNPPPELDWDKDEVLDLLKAQLVALKTPSKNASARGWINYGNQLWRIFLSEEAIGAFNQAIQLNPNSYAAWYARSLALMEVDRYREAVRSFERAIQIDDRPYEIWRERARAFYYLKDPEALASIEEAIQRNNQEAALYMSLGEYFKS